MSTGKAVRPAIVFEGVSPILRVGSRAASLAYYTGVLGFAKDWVYAGTIACVSRGRCSLFLSEGDQGNPGSWVWIGVSDVDALYGEYLVRGARIRQPPTDFEWSREMQVQDPDGNVLRMGAAPREGVPMGPWVDMRGDMWTMQLDGSWIRSPVDSPR